MKHTISRVLVALAIVAAGSGSLIAGFGGIASATSPAPWEPVGSPEVGNLLLFNSAGQQITGGNLTDAPIAAYVEGTTTLRTGDTKATLKAYTPVSGQPVGAWTGGLLSASASTFPDTGAPSNLASSGLPLVTGTSSDNSLATYISSNPNADTSTTDGYGGVYVLRLVTSGPGLSATATYDATDIQVTGSTWSVVYPAPVPIGTTTTLSELPTSPQQAGTSVQLNATVTAADSSTPAGSVQFKEGGTDIGSPVLLVSGAASTSTSTLPVGSADALSAVFTPAANTLYATSTGSSTYQITATPATATTTALGVNPASGPEFASTTVTATVATSPGGTDLSGGGSVAFYDNGTTNTPTISSSSVKIGTVPVGTGGTAVLSWAATSVGDHYLVAQFTPADSPTDATYDPSTTPSAVLYDATAAAGATPDTQDVEVNIPAGSITITTPYDSSDPLNLGTATIDANDATFDAHASFGTASDASGTDPNGGVTITDTRADDQSWTASVLASDFTTTGPGTIPASDLSFTGVTPAYITGDALQSPDVTTDDIAALANASQKFATATASSSLHSVDGSVNIYGNINLVAPTSTPAGEYTTTLTFTVS
jgi:hypothetical protein